VQRLLTFIICCFVLATGYMAYVIAERQTALQKVARYNNAWSVSQALSEYMRLEHRLAAYQLGMAGVGEAEIRLRLDIMLGRVDLLRQGSLRPFMQGEPGREALLLRLDDALQALQGRLDMPAPRDFRAVLEQLSALDGEMTALASAASTHDAEVIDADQEELRQLHLVYTALAGGLIVCGIGLILLLLRHNRLLDRAQVDMRLLTDNLRTASHELKGQNDRLAHMANHDALTGLPNRHLFRQELEDRLVTMKRGGAPFAVLLLDLDGFKDVNDTLGHDAGDALLRGVAERLRRTAGPQDLVCRLGGDEFAVLGAAATQEDALDKAQRLIDEVRAPYGIKGREVAIGTSVGIGLARPDLDTDAILKHADLALYEAKRLGRGRASIFRSELQTTFHARKSFEADLRKALPNGEMEVYYQAQADARTREIVGYEALLRWNHPERGQMPPSEFIPVAEETGLIHALGEWVLRTATLEAAGWHTPLTIAVNLSPVQFRSKALFQQVRQALVRSGLSPERLELEITESMLLDRNQQTLDMLRRLKKAGIQIAMDDFGTGYSSLGSLRSFPFDRIKIDRSFIRDIPARRDAVTIVELIIGMAEGHGIETTAEGIETEEQFACLERLGCGQMQGYLIGRPAPAASLAHLRRASLEAAS